MPLPLGEELKQESLLPKRTDLHSILIIGSEPIVIGQACEFDYSETQGCKAAGGLPRHPGEQHPRYYNG